MDQEIVYLTAQEVDSAGANMALAIDCVEETLSLHERNQVKLPSKVILDMDERRHGRINAMPAYVGGKVHMCGLKWIAGFPNNPSRYGLPRANALIVLNDPETGIPLAIMEGTRISALRTGAVTGVGAKYLARPDSRSLGLIGAGVQSFTQLDALRHILPGIDEVRVFDIRGEAAESFVSRCDGLSARAAETPEDAVRGADLIVTATVADEPIVKADWLKPGSFFAHVGSYQEEEEAVILQADKVVVDIWEEVLHRGTPLLAQMFGEGKIDASRIHANIGEIINGDKPGRETADERVFYSPLGLGSEDVAVAAEVYRRAIQMNLGRRLPFGGQAF
ncbi:MAG: ornithine cyclodeaminase [Armatimonadetes bacterium]|nr:ornithine cyclodeaminase [Armatimonadota bacterium]